MVISAPQDARGNDAPAGRRRRWRGRARPDVIPQGDWPELAGRLLALRGVTDAAGARAFFDPPSAQPDSYALPALDIAIDRLLRAVRSRECVAIFGDFDVDGVTSAAQLTEAISALGGVAMPYIPDRFTEGYGLNAAAIETLHRDGATLLVTADCGTSSIEEVACARALGMDVIILDHHTVPPVLPNAYALVNPKRDGATPGGLLELATAGLAAGTLAGSKPRCPTLIGRRDSRPPPSRLSSDEIAVEPPRPTHTGLLLIAPRRHREITGT